MNGTFQLGDISPLRYFLMIGLISGLMFGLITPTEGVLEAVVSIGQWTLTSTVGLGVVITTHVILLRIPAFEVRPAWQQLIASGGIGAMGFAPIAYLLDVLLEGDSLASSAVTLALGVAEEFGAIVLPVTLVWVAINAPFLLGFQLKRVAVQRPQERPSGPTTQPGPDTTPFLEQVDPTIRGRVIYLKAELHYLLVVTEYGRDLILYSLKDAVTELGDRGIQCHRSWWVDANAVESFERDGRQGRLRLTNGEVVPVSRRKIAEVQALIDARSVNVIQPVDFPDLAGVDERVHRPNHD